MENQNRWNLDSDAVVNGAPSTLRNFTTGTVEELRQRIRQSLGDLAPLVDGAYCRVLEPGKYWSRGNVRLVIEFEPDENQTP